MGIVNRYNEIQQVQWLADHPNQQPKSGDIKQAENLQDMLEQEFGSKDTEPNPSEAAPETAEGNKDSGGLWEFLGF